MARGSRRAALGRIPVRTVLAGIVTLLLLLTFNDATATNRSAPTALSARPGTVPAELAVPPGVLPAVEGVTAHGPWDPSSWFVQAGRVVDSTTLAREGVTVPEGANVFAARIVDGGSSPAYLLYEAGGGAFANGFFPASSIKVLAAVGALELAASHGLTGGATVDGAYALSEFYDGAIRYSSNEDYDDLVRFAGVGWLNREFLPSRGYRATTIQEGYADLDGVTASPSVHLAEGDLEVDIPERYGEDDYGCGGANCSNLFELVDSVRRVVLHDELPVEERFAIAPADVAGLQDALLGAESWIGPGVAAALGPDAVVYSKPGWTSGYDCVDVGVVVDGETGDRYLVGVSAPDDGECAMLAPMATEVLTVVAGDDDGAALRTDGSVVQVVDGRPRAEQP